MKCYFADGAPTILSDEAGDGWGMTLFNDLWVKAHSRYKDHDDGKGHCKACGCALDFDAWMDQKDAEEAQFAGGDWKP